MLAHPSLNSLCEGVVLKCQFQVLEKMLAYQGAKVNIFA